MKYCKAKKRILTIGPVQLEVADASVQEKGFRPQVSATKAAACIHQHICEIVKAAIAGYAGAWSALPPPKVVVEVRVLGPDD